MAKTETKTVEINGTEVIFYPNSHKYKIFDDDGNGKWIPSVTGVCGVVDKSRPLLIWASNLCRDFLWKLPVAQRVNAAIQQACDLYNEKKVEASDTGTIVHDFCEKWVKSQIENSTEPFDVGEYMKDVHDESAINGITAFWEWCSTHDIFWLMSEKIVYSKVHNYVGTFDATAIIDGRKTIIDFKTSSRVNKEYWLQTSAYLQALCEETGEKPEHYDRIVLRFDKKTGFFESVPFTNYENDVAWFNSAIVLTNSLKNIDEEIKAYQKAHEQKQEQE